MIYLDYSILKKKLQEAERRLDLVIEEKELLFNKTQPRGVQSDKEKVTGGGQASAFDQYLIEKEMRQIDERILEAKEIIRDRKALLLAKEQELRASKEAIDRVYVGLKLDRKKVTQIMREVSYSKAQIYRLLDIINQENKR